MKNLTKRLALVLVLCLTVLALTGCDSSDYKKATALYEEGSYLEAAAIFEALADYENSADMALECKYAEAAAQFAAANYDAAEALFAQLGSYKDSQQQSVDCKYQKANALFDAQDFEGAIAVYETISDYSDCAQRLADARKELMYLNYGDVIELLGEHTWYFNGGSDSILNGIRFTRDEAVLKQVNFTGNGKMGGAENNYSYLVDADSITVTLADGSELEIPYTVSGSEVALGSGEYITEKQVAKDIQGYWMLRKSQTILGMNAVNEYHIYFGAANMTMEKAAKSAVRGTDYFYYGPFDGSYTLDFGSFNTDMTHGNEWFFNIIDGEVAVLHYDSVCSRSDGFPGEHGYSF